MCRVLGISEQEYYRALWRSEKGWWDKELSEQIYECLQADEENGHNYGVRRVYRICRERCWPPAKTPPNGVLRADRQPEKSEKLINRDFTVPNPNKKFLTDVTEIPCSARKLYLAAVPDCFDCSIQGFHMDDNMKTELCVQVLENVCRGNCVEGAILLHSGQGSPFTSQAFRAALRRHKLLQSMSSAGRCYDSARMKSFFATLKKEKLYQIDTARLCRDKVKSAVFRYICYYSLRRVSSVTAGLRLCSTGHAAWKFPAPPWHSPVHLYPFLAFLD